jgi:hypothetical protein
MLVVSNRDKVAIPHPLRGIRDFRKKLLAISEAAGTE